MIPTQALSRAHAHTGWLVRLAALVFLFSWWGLASAEDTTAARAAGGSGKRVALIIGNATYQNGALKNPVNDARAMAKLLGDAGFAVVVAENATRARFIEAMEEFTAKLEGAAVGVFYYAGHGIQIRDRNFLVPVDAKGGNEDTMIDASIDAARVLDRMAAAGTRINLVFLDACRDNPFAKTFRSEAKGLAPMDAKRTMRNTVIAFATAPGSVFFYVRGDNGIYTKHLLKHLPEPGVPLEQALKRVRAGVITETGDKQVPWESSSLIEDFVFVPGADVAKSAQVASQDSAKSAGGEAWQRELAFWESVKNSTHPEDFEAYLKAYPAGTFVGLAKSKMERLRETEEAPEAEPAAEPKAAVAATLNRNAKAADGPRPRVGDVWAYDVRLKHEPQGTLRIAVTEVGEEQLTESITFTKSSAFSAEREVRLGLNTDKFIDPLLTLPGGMQLPEIAPYILPGTDLAAEDVWEKIPCEFTHSLLGTRKFKCVMKVIGKENVKVPAGTFEAWKIEVLSEKIESKLMRFRVTFWYAPSVARSVKMEVGTVLMGGIAVPQLYELSSVKTAAK